MNTGLNNINESTRPAGKASGSIITAREKMFTPPNPEDVIEFNGVRYWIERIIDEGHFGTVYECTDEWGNNLVAKVFKPNGTYEEVREKWNREYETLTMLRNPNITHVYAAFEYQETFYLIVERCTNTVASLIGKGSNSSIWIRPLSRCLLEAVGYMHQNDYVHKDIHPGNVFLSFIRDELLPNEHQALKFKLGDLGISAFVPNLNPRYTTLALWMLPPERLDPLQFGELGKLVDIYQVGLLLLNLVENRIHEFTREQILDGLPRKLAENSQSKYARAIAKALRRHVQDRTQSALEFWKDIEACDRQKSNSIVNSPSN